MDFHETWMKDGSWPRIDPIHFNPVKSMDVYEKKMQKDPEAGWYQPHLHRKCKGTVHTADLALRYSNQGLHRVYVVLY